MQIFLGGEAEVMFERFVKISVWNLFRTHVKSTGAFRSNNEYVNKMLAENASVRINVPPLPVMKDEISVAGETEGVQSVKNKINLYWLSKYKDIICGFLQPNSLGNQNQ